jgi:hypothetical protein
MSSKTTHPKQHKYPKQLHPKPNQRPLHQDKQHARPESQRALPLLFAREKDKRPLRAEEERDADEEQDVAHGEQGAVEEEDQAEQEEEAAAAAEGDADFCRCRVMSVWFGLVCLSGVCSSFSFFWEMGRTLRVGEPVGRHDGWLGAMRERVGRFRCRVGCVCSCGGRKRSQLGCCGRLCILIASLNSQFNVVGSSGRAVVLWRVGLILNVSWETCCADSWGRFTGSRGKRLDKGIAASPLRYIYV